MILGIRESNQKIVTNGLVLHLDAAQLLSYTSGSSTWSDLSGNGGVGTLTNGPTFDSDAGGNINYDGSNDTVSVPHQSAYNVTAVTCILFVKTPVSYTGNFRAIFSKEGASRDFNFYARSASGNGIIDYFHLSVGSIGGHSTEAGIGSLTLNKWHQVGFSIGGGTLYYILNGSILKSESYTGTFTANNSYQLKVGSADNYWSGKIANCLLYNRVLSTSEILQNYNATKTRFGL